MRLFPRTARRRLSAAAIATALAAGAFSIPQASADDLQDRQQRVEKRLAGADRAVQHSSNQLQRAYDALRAAQAELAEARSRLETTLAQLGQARERNRELKDRLALARARLAQAQTNLEAGRASLEMQREAVTDLVADLYQDGDSQLQAFSSMLQAQDPADLTWTQEGQSVMVDRQTEAYDQLRATEVLLRVREDQLQAAEAGVAEQQAEALAQVTLMQGLTSQARSVRTEVREVVDRRRETRAQAQRVKANDEAQLRRLKEQEQRIKEKIARAAAQSNVGYRGRSGGFLAWPLPGGYVTSPYGFREHPIYGYYSLHDGIDIGGGCGMPLQAAGSGTVVAKYFSSVYGNRLFVYLGRVNGKELTIVYNHSASYGVSVGQQVSRGQVVGRVGNTGWSTGCHVHFTLLADGEPVNPTNYM